MTAPRPDGMREEQAGLGVPPAEDDLYEMTNIFPRTSGLPMTVWISPRGRARHDARVKVCRVPGNRMVPEETAVVSVRPVPELLEGELDGDALRAVRAWVLLNQEVILDFWNGGIDGVELGQRLRKLGPDAPGGMREEQASLHVPVDEDEMFDMTNLSSRRTGLDGVIFASTAQGRHGPRVKWYPGRPSGDAPCLVVTLEDPPRAINMGLPQHVARRAEEAVARWVDLNRAALMGYWKDGLGWTEEERDAFLDGLQKLP